MIRSEHPAIYSARKVRKAELEKEEDAVIAKAMTILRKRLRKTGQAFCSPTAAQQWVKLNIGGEEREIFYVLYLNNRNQLIEARVEFTGTIDAAAVYPREIVKSALSLNAAAVILSHNHPSGEPEPSLADRQITERLIEALRHIDVRVLDHIVVGGDKHVSFAERGYITTV